MKLMIPENGNGHMKGHEPQTALLLKANIICGLMRMIAAIEMLKYPPACLPCGSLL